MKKVAMLCFENPFSKPSDGAKNDMSTRIFALAKIEEICIDLYVFNKPGETFVPFEYSKYKIRNFFQYNIRSIGIDWFLSGFPISVYKRFTQECIDELAMHHYDAIIYEGEHMASYKIKKVVSADKHILRQHDIESIYRYELSRAAPTILYKIAQRLEAKLYKCLEKDIDSHFDIILFISKSEKEIFDNQYIETKSSFVFMPPAAVEIFEKPVYGKKDKVILYFGNMELQNNVLSILWFAQEVFPLILKEEPDVILKVVGKISEKNKTLLQHCSKNIFIIGYVDDLQKEIIEACFIVSPVLYGAGIKVKVIDALGYGQIVCATSKAIEGTELENRKHLIVEDNVERMKDACIDIIRNRKNYELLLNEGQKFVRKYHSVQHQAEILSHIIGQGQGNES